MPQNQQQRGPRVVIGLNAVSADERQIQVRATVYKNGTPQPNVEVAFSIDGIQHVGPPKRTDVSGLVMETLATPPDANSVQIQAEAEGFAKTVTVPVQKSAPVKKEQPQLRLITERTKIEPGHYRLNLIVVDPKEKGVDSKLTLVSSADFKIDGKAAARNKRSLSVPASGVNVELTFDVPHLEMDVFVAGISAKVQLEFWGHKPQQPAQPGDGLLKHLFDGWK
ncbi:MAG: hypothetical protein ACM3NH_03490 [Candidatus Saccharibacteria bacterium]